GASGELGVVADGVELRIGEIAGVDARDEVVAGRVVLDLEIDAGPVDPARIEEIVDEGHGAGGEVAGERGVCAAERPKAPRRDSHRGGLHGGGTTAGEVSEHLIDLDPEIRGKRDPVREPTERLDP